MRGAPPVSYPVGRSRKVDCLLGSLWAGGACCAVAAALHHADPLGWWTLLLALGVLWAGIAAWHIRWLQARTAELRFDGEHWSFVAGIMRHGAMAQAAIILDFQSLLLVRLAVSRRAARWVWLDRSVRPGHWQDLRRALYSRASSAGAGAGPGGVASVAGSKPQLP